MQTIWRRLVPIYRTVFLAHGPQCKARMNDISAFHKYVTIHYPISDAELVAHLAGKLTLAAPLISRERLARAAVLDIDHGGEAALRRVLTVARWRGLAAFALTSSNTAHDGGHVWLLFDNLAEGARFRALASDLAMEAEVIAETYPTFKTIRLPLGIHRWSRQRGRVIFQTHHELDLDRGVQSIQQALHLIAHLPRNAVRLVPEIPPPVAQSISELQRPLSRWAASIIEAYNQSTNLITLLESYGGIVAQRLWDDGVLMHCPCHNHSNGDLRPSLVIRTARRQRYGHYVAYGYAPACRFYTDVGQIFDAFSVYCLMENTTPREAVRELVNRGK